MVCCKKSYLKRVERKMSRNHTNKKFTGRKEPIFFESFEEIDTSRIVYEKPVMKNFFGSEYWYSFAFYKDDNNDLRKLYYYAPERYSHFGLSLSYPPGLRPQQTKDGDRITNMEEANGIQMTYMFHSNETSELYEYEKNHTEEELEKRLEREDPEIQGRFIEERKYRKFIEELDTTILEEVRSITGHDADASKTQQTTYLPPRFSRTFRNADDQELEKMVRKSYMFPDASKRTVKSDRRPNNSPRSFIPVNTKGKGEKLQCSVSFIADDEDDDTSYSAFDLIDKRGFIKPVKFFEGFSWNGKKDEIALPRYHITEGKFRESEAIQSSTSFLRGKTSKKIEKGSKFVEEDVEEEDTVFSKLRREKESSRYEASTSSQNISPEIESTNEEIPAKKKRDTGKKVVKKKTSEKEEDPIKGLREAKKKVLGKKKIVSKKRSDEEEVED